MDAVAIAFIVMGSGIASVIILHLLHGGGSKKKTTTSPSAQRLQTADLKRGEKEKTTTDGDKDGGLVILEGVGAAMEISSTVVDTVGGGGGGDGGSGSGGGGNCSCMCGGGGSCGGCGGCGGD